MSSLCRHNESYEHKHASICFFREIFYNVTPEYEYLHI